MASLTTSPDNEILKFPPRSKEQFLEDFASLCQKKKRLKKSLTEESKAYIIFHNLATAYNICLRKENQLLTFAKSQDWI